MAKRDVCHDGCADRAGDETEFFIRCVLWVRKISAGNSDRIFGLEKSIHESTKSDENLKLAAPFLPDFLLRITDKVDIKQPLHSGCGHKMGNTNCGKDCCCLLSFMLEVKDGEGKISNTNLFIRERAFAFVASSVKSQASLLGILVAGSCDDSID